MLKSITAILLAIANFFTLLFTDIERIPELPYSQTINFESISAKEAAVSKAEKESCREWYEKNILLKSDKTQLPYSFRYGLKTLSSSLDEWDIEVSPESETGAVYAGGKTSYITLNNPENGLQATVEATIYEENATCEWTVFIKNTGNENSETISSFYALDAQFETGNTELYYSKGSCDEPYDFALLTRQLSIFPSSFGCADGRPTDTYLPYFNIHGTNCSVVLGVGWTGHWLAEMTNFFDNTSIKVGQEKLKAYLLPGEEIRSPLVSLSFYQGDNAVKGFNIFRSFVADCVYPENIPDTLDMMEVAGPLSTNTADQIIDSLNSFGDHVYEQIDYFWMDAGWYSYEESWSDCLGNWRTPDTNRYDNGIIELSDYAANKGCGLVLWFEPERTHPDTAFYKKGSENSEWLIYNDESDFAMFNLANEDALKYFCEEITAALKENGVSVYRQDFNFSPAEFWSIADKEYYGSRKGICENHYVTNLYRYLDYLCENIEGLIIDNCAAGGRRLDLEMTRRSIPVWRSDYNCLPHENILEATQAQTYGISFWLPLSGTVQYNTDEYAARSSIMPLTLETFGTIFSEHFADYNIQREMMSGNFYPLECGGYDDTKILAMQYSSPDAENGEAFVYKRAEVKDTAYTLTLSGLDAEKTYEIYSVDSPETVHTLTGDKLMTSGLEIELPEGKKAFIFMFSAV